MIEIFYNNPIDFEILKQIYSDKDDLQSAWPGAKYPLCVGEWNTFLQTSDQYASLIFKTNGTIIGHLVLKPKIKEQLFICFVILDKKFRGKGIIYEMLTLTEQFALTHFSHDKLWLHVDPENIVAVRVYERMGYVFMELTDAGRLRMNKKIKNF
jgi:RimJ/RimL family protein N-acetyltransferase